MSSTNNTTATPGVEFASAYAFCDVTGEKEEIYQGK